jgi:hypothetical protein
MLKATNNHTLFRTAVLAAALAFAVGWASAFVAAGKTSNGGRPVFAKGAIAPELLLSKRPEWRI